MLAFGLLGTTFELLTFLVLLRVFRTDEPTVQTAWFVVSLMTELDLVLRTTGLPSETNSLRRADVRQVIARCPLMFIAPLAKLHIVESPRRSAGAS